VIGAEIIGDHGDELLNTAAACALSHHEKWDGSGYPSGLAGEEIPLVARVVAIADVFDALTCERPYKKAWSVEASVAEIRRFGGTHFDPALVDAFVRALPEMVAEMTQPCEEAEFPLPEHGSTAVAFF
jgi:putative two-component system response regulator